MLSLRMGKRNDRLREIYERFPQDEAKRMMRLLVTPKQEEQHWDYQPEEEHTQDAEDEGGHWTHIPTPTARNFSRPFSKQDLLLDTPTTNHTEEFPTTPSPRTTQTNNSTPISRFEVQLQSVKERLEAAKAGSTRGLGIGGGSAGAPGFNFGVGPRIAKPLRGGGGGVGEQQHQAVSGLQAQASEGAGGNKRSSWFFNQRA
jgi:hypothetical protein